jgi:hypothetical protein
MSAMTVVPPAAPGTMNTEALIALAAVLALGAVAVMLARQRPAPVFLLVVVKAEASRSDGEARRHAMRQHFDNCQRLLCANAHVVYMYATQTTRIFNVPRGVPGPAYQALQRDATAFAQWAAGYLHRNTQATLDQLVAAAIESPLGEPANADDFLRMLFGTPVDGAIDKPELTKNYCRLTNARNVIATFHDRPNCARQRYAALKLAAAADVAREIHVINQ